MRIVSLLPSATEILCAIGLADSIVGISHECDYPLEIRERPRVTRSQFPAELPSHEIDQRVQGSIARQESLYAIEAKHLAALAPDLVVTQRQCSVCAVGETDALRALGQVGSRARVVSLAASRFEELPEDIRKLGQATDSVEQAEAVVHQLRTRLEIVRDHTRNPHRPRVFCLSWFNPLMAAGHWMSQMVELAGGEDRLGARAGSSTILYPVTLEGYAPEVILLLPCGFTQSRTRREWESVRSQSFWANLPAVRAGRIFVLEGSLFHRPSPRLVDGVELLATLLHPERWGGSHNQTAAWRVA